MSAAEAPFYGHTNGSVDRLQKALKIATTRHCFLCQKLGSEGKDSVEFVILDDTRTDYKNGKMFTDSYLMTADTTKKRLERYATEAGSSVTARAARLTLTCAGGKLEYATFRPVRLDHLQDPQFAVDSLTLPLRRPTDRNLLTVECTEAAVTINGIEAEAVAEMEEWLPPDNTTPHIATTVAERIASGTIINY